ncbi:hypothetical protein Y048_6413 [Burkholderia pseudomallei MSHR456]|nr:hypothetical protein Y048_6413 [Burkholderia pseudomallei MSHR456]
MPSTQCYYIVRRVSLAHNTGPISPQGQFLPRLRAARARTRPNTAQHDRGERAPIESALFRASGCSPSGDSRTCACPCGCYITRPESSGAVQGCHVALETIGSQILDRFALEMDAPFDAQLERAPFLREYQPRSRHQATVLATIERHPMSTAISPLDVAFEGLDCLRVREKYAAWPTAFGDRTGQADFFLPRA